MIITHKGQCITIASPGLFDGSRARKPVFSIKNISFTISRIICMYFYVQLVVNNA